MTVAAYVRVSTRRQQDDSQRAEIKKWLDAKVEVGVAAEKPTCRIVHLRDWHFVPKDLYAIDVKQAHGWELTVAEIDRLLPDLLLEAEIIQFEQTALMRCLIRYHGLKRVFSEGVTAKDYPNFVEIMGIFADMEKSQVGPLRKELVGFRERLVTMDPKSDNYDKVKKIETEMADLIHQHDHRL